jgi:hypothetical protein
MNDTHGDRVVKFIGAVVAIIGIVMTVAGGFTWYTVRSQLIEESITVAKITEQNPGTFAGKRIDDPFTAYAQANAIKEHVIAGGKAFDAQQRQYASFLRASLYTSVISFGVSVLVFALGIIFILIGFALVKVSDDLVHNNSP